MKGLLLRLADWLGYFVVPRDFVVVTIDGAGCTMTPVEACQMLQDVDDLNDLCYEFQPIRMTAARFDALAEFNGW